MGLYTVDAGEVYGCRRNMFAYVPQGNQLMSGSIRDIITFSDKDKSSDESGIYRALRIACADGFIAELEQGIDTLLGERGLGLSEGQMAGPWPEVLFYHYLRNSMADCPNCFVPLSEEEMKRKEEMIGLYRSQSPAWLFREEKETNIFYGRKLGVPYAEALTRLQPLPPGSPSILETLEP